MRSQKLKQTKPVRP